MVSIIQTPGVLARSGILMVCSVAIFLFLSALILSLFQTLMARARSAHLNLRVGIVLYISRHFVT
jgi:hypothetical protein